MIPGVVREAARRFRDRVALVAPDGAELTYIDLFAHSEAVAAGLARRGVRPGDVVALALPSSLDYVDRVPRRRARRRDHDRRQPALLAGRAREGHRARAARSS